MAAAQNVHRGVGGAVEHKQRRHPPDDEPDRGLVIGVDEQTGAADRSSPAGVQLFEGCTLRRSVDAHEIGDREECRMERLPHRPHVIESGGG